MEKKKKIAMGIGIAAVVVLGGYIVMKKIIGPEISDKIKNSISASSSGNSTTVNFGGL